MPRKGFVTVYLKPSHARAAAVFLRRKYSPAPLGMATIALLGSTREWIEFEQLGKAKELARKLLKASKRKGRRIRDTEFEMDIARADAQWLASNLPPGPMQDRFSAGLRGRGRRRLSDLEVRLRIDEGRSDTSVIEDSWRSRLRARQSRRGMTAARLLSGR